MDERRDAGEEPDAARAKPTAPVVAVDHPLDGVTASGFVQTS
jgi:hypothetical protein